MIRPPRRRVMWLSGLALLVCGQALALPSSLAESVSACEALRLWARPYASTRPSLEELARLDRPHRLAALAAVTPVVRADLWQEHFRRFAEQPDLSVAQRALVEEGRGVATPAAYAGDASARAAMKRLWVRAEPAFATSVHRRAWFDLATFVPLEAGRWNGIGRMQMEGYCACNTEFPDYDCYVGFCQPSGGCMLSDGCGPWGRELCNGACG